MVDVRLVDCSDPPEEQPVRPIPEMMFAVGEEPVGVRVLTYLSSGAINNIFNALEDEEVQIIRRSAFGKILEIVDKPVFSGRFARFILSRQLKTKKKHEAWFRFAGKPIRFSLREFAIVTGLPCGKFPMKSKMKLKETISEKPYWPSLFGKAEVATVASMIKLLTRRSVADRAVRIKYACLAILSSVLLPTNMKMKICREHAEAIEDLDEFFSYPWGRLAFDMLMGIIKERDEVALSQNTIAVKGFAPALQLVMVEAVPSLTEVVQEMCSDSEGDSNEEHDGMSEKPNRKTLSPGHARNVDKETDLRNLHRLYILVFVRSIIDEDPLRPIDESNLVWFDEEDDEKVNNMVYLINTNFQFTKSMFVGGLSKLDVDRMRETDNLTSKAKKSKKLPVLTPSNDPGYIASLVIEKMKPEFQTMDGNIMQACRRVDSIEGSLVGLVHSVFGKLKEEMLESVRHLITALTKEEGAAPATIPHNLTNTAVRQNGIVPDSNSSPVIEANDQTIRNILGNLSSYSTPPNSPRLSQAENLTPKYNKGGLYCEARGDNVNDSFAPSAHSQNHQRAVEINQPLEEENRVHGPLMDMPSFSLGLAQEDALNGNHGITFKECVRHQPESIVKAVDNIEVQHQGRKNKRQKCVPHALFEDYECGPEIVSRVKKSQNFIFSSHERNLIHRKYARLLQRVNRHFVYKVGGVSVLGKDILLIAERSKFLTSKVDILIRLVQYTVQQQFTAHTQHRDVFLDNTYASAITKTYPKFCKSRKKDTYIFPRGVVKIFTTRDDAFLQPTRYYFPLNVGKKNWVGICVDHHCGKITVLDSNTSLFTDAMMEKHLQPHLLMLPYLLRLSMQVSGTDEPKRFAVERPKDLSQTKNPSDAGLMAVLFMSTHAVYGLEACKNINTDVLVEAGRSAAVMAFECKDML
ncbi:uncharacterized protein LOC106372932 [Brassica napus]|uniref:uncharacterized protein LOC106372932 n=1 Tax=Brassica napus TaxID=3708 RepID=UPI0006AB520B|nr:uncharacterized protein LOC106372932 [Brassica napus]